MNESSPAEVARDNELPFAERWAMLRKLLQGCPAVLAAAGYRTESERVKDYDTFVVYSLSFISPSGNIHVTFRMFEWRGDGKNQDQLAVTLLNENRSDSFDIGTYMQNGGAYHLNLAGPRLVSEGPFPEWLEKRLGEYLEILSRYLQDTVNEKEWPDWEKVVWPI